MKLYAIPCAILLQTMSLAHADERVLQCKEITDDASRLKCFDQIAKPSQAAAAGAWKVAESKSELDRSRTVTISLAADRVVTSSSFGKDSAVLIIRCEENNMSFVVAYSSLASNNAGLTPVKYRIGETPPKASEWVGAQNNKAYGLWETSKSVPIIKQAISADDFFVRGEAKIFGTTEASFKLTGLSEAIKPIREACKW